MNKVRHTERWRKLIWCQNEKVSNDISENRRLWKLWKAGGSKDKQLDAKRKTQHAVSKAKENAENEKFASDKDNKGNTFPVAKQMRMETQDETGQKCIRADDGNLSLDDTFKKLAWKQHYERLLNIKFPSQNRPYVDVAAGPAQLITPDDILKFLRCMKNEKAVGPSGVVAEMLKAAPDICRKIIADLMNAVIVYGKGPVDSSYNIVSLFQGKGDALD